LITIPSTLMLLYFHFKRGNSRIRADLIALILASTPVFIWLPLPSVADRPNPILPALCLSAHLTGFWYRALAKKIDHYLPQSSVTGSRARGFSELRIFLIDALFPLLGGFIAYFARRWVRSSMEVF